MDTLRRWAEPAMRAAADAGDPVLFAGAEALAALGASWDGDRETADRRLDHASARLRELDDRALAICPAVLMHVGVAQFLCERFEDAAATAARAIDAGAPQRPGPAAADAVRTARERAASRGSNSTRRCARPRRPRRRRASRGSRPCCISRSGSARWSTRRAAKPREAERSCAMPPRWSARSSRASAAYTARVDLAAIDAAHDPERALREILAADGPNSSAPIPTTRSAQFLRLVRAALALTGSTTRRRGPRPRPPTATAAAAGRLRRAACARAEVLLARGEAAEAARLAQQASADAEAAAPARTRSTRSCWPAARSPPRNRCSGSWPRPAAPAPAPARRRGARAAADRLAPVRPRAARRRTRRLGAERARAGDRAAGRRREVQQAGRRRRSI